MKLTKSEFKKLLKECLVEILTEEPAVKQMFKESLVHNRTKLIEQNQQTNNRTYNSVEPFQNKFLMEKVDMMATSLAEGNSSKAELMKSIFADTAVNTLPQQREIAGGVAAGQLMTEQTDGVNIDSLIENDVSHWAQVAFSKK